MKSLQHVIDAVLAHLRSWPALYADPGTGRGEPTIPPASAAAALGIRPPADGTLEVRAPEPAANTSSGRSCYRVAPTEWGVTASRPAERTASRRDADPRTPHAPARRRGSSLLGADVLPPPRTGGVPWTFPDSRS